MWACMTFTTITAMAAQHCTTHLLLGPRVFQIYACYAYHFDLGSGKHSHGRCMIFIYVCIVHSCKSTHVQGQTTTSIWCTVVLEYDVWLYDISHTVRACYCSTTTLQGTVVLHTVLRVFQYSYHTSVYNTRYRLLHTSWFLILPQERTADRVCRHIACY